MDDRTIESAPDPVIETRVEYIRICPAELLLEVEPVPSPGPLAELTGNEQGMAWLHAVTTYAGMLADRIADARAGCP